MCVDLWESGFEKETILVSRNFLSLILIPEMGVKTNFSMITKNHAACSHIESPKKSILEPLELTSPTRKPGSLVRLTIPNSQFVNIIRAKDIYSHIYCVFWVFSASVPKYRKYAIFLVSRNEQSAAEHFGVHTARESSESIDAGLEPWPSRKFKVIITFYMMKNLSKFII